MNLAEPGRTSNRRIHDKGDTHRLSTHTTDISNDTGVDTTQRAFAGVRRHLSEKIIGQLELVDRLLIALLAGGHLLVEGLSSSA